MKRKTSAFVLAVSLGVALILGLAGCQAAGPSYPTKEITFIVPSPQGASTDQACRALTDSVAKYMGQTFTLKNVGAAGGTAAATEVFTAKPDGYTIGMTMVLPMALQPHLMGKDIPYKGPEDFTMVQQIYARANVLTVLPSSPYNSLADLVNDFKSGKRTEPFTYGGRGVGNAEHLTMEMFLRAAGLKEGQLKVVPFQNDGEASAALLGGHIDGTAFMWAATKPLLEEKRVKVLGSFADFPGMEKYGLKSAQQQGFDVSWPPRHYIIMPKGVPQEILTKVDDAFKKGAEDKAFSDYVDKVGDYLAYKPGPEALKDLQNDYKVSGELAQELGLIK